MRPAFPEASEPTNSQAGWMFKLGGMLRAQTPLIYISRKQTKQKLAETSWCSTSPMFCEGQNVNWAVLRSLAKSLTFGGLNGHPPLKPKNLKTEGYRRESPSKMVHVEGDV